jgi:hypothetical protein
MDQGANGGPTKRLPASCILPGFRSHRLGQAGPYGGASHRHHRVGRYRRCPSDCPRKGILQRDTTDSQTVTALDRWPRGDRSSGNSAEVCAASLARLDLHPRPGLLIDAAVAVDAAAAAAAVVAVAAVAVAVAVAGVDAAECAAAFAVESFQRSPIASSADPHPSQAHSHGPSTSEVWKASTPRQVVVVVSYRRAT